MNGFGDGSHRKAEEVEHYSETDKHIVVFGLLMGFVENNKKFEHCQPYP